MLQSVIVAYVQTCDKASPKLVLEIQKMISADRFEREVYKTQKVKNNLIGIKKSERDHRVGLTKYIIFILSGCSNI